MPDSSPVKRACDACHRRKVKCIGDGTGLKPCRNCTQAGLGCTYNAIPQKKGPKGCRAKVISELREHQRQSRLAIKTDRFAFPPGASPTTSPTFPTPTSLVLPPELIDCCVEYFFAQMYPTQPILNRDALRQTIASMNHSPEAYCFVVILCAYMLIQPNLKLPASVNMNAGATSPISTDDASSTAASNLALGTALLEEAQTIRKTYNYQENPTTITTTTCFFFFGCYFCLENRNLAWIHLREASTLAIVLGMNREDTYKELEPIDATVRRRLYWLLFVTERAFAMQKSKPLSLHATIALPRVDDEPGEELALTGFLHLINLFKPFDDTFVGLWNQSIEGCQAGWILKLQKQLSAALPSYLKSTETQAVDLCTSQQWLRIMVWQLAISHRLLASTGMDASLTFRYPIEMSRVLVRDTKNFTQAAMEVHGIGLTKKFFDVACTLLDVMACLPMERQHFEIGPRDYLNQFLHVISRLRGGKDRYLPLLLSKINDMNDPSLSDAVGLGMSVNSSLPLPVAGSPTSVVADSTSDAEHEQSGVALPALMPGALLPSSIEGATAFTTSESSSSSPTATTRTTITDPSSPTLLPATLSTLSQPPLQIHSHIHMHVHAQAQSQTHLQSRTPTHLSITSEPSHFTKPFSIFQGYSADGDDDDKASIGLNMPSDMDTDTSDLDAFLASGSSYSPGPYSPTSYSPVPGYMSPAGFGGVSAGGFVVN